MSKTPIQSFFRLARERRGGPSSPQTFRDAGDRARDAHDWPAAAKAYETYLAATPDDAAIWVQYGHTLKEGGRLAEAEDAYRKVLGLKPDDADVRLHLAHLLKRLERRAEASEMFLEVAKRASTSEVWQELERAGYGMLARTSLAYRPAAAARNGIYVELKDLFQHLNLHTTLTGITRVTLGLVQYILENMDERKAAQYHFVHQFRDAEGALLISKDNMRQLVLATMSDEPDHNRLKALIASIRENSPVFRLADGDTYLIIGAFWEFVGNPGWLSGMRRRGVTVGSFIYDLIPITHPQFCDGVLTEAFTVSFAETARLLDFALTISEFVAHEVNAFLVAHGIEAPPVRAVPLAHELRFEAKRVGDAMRRSGAYLQGIPFVLCVCTIEARKNHLYIFEIWQRMLKAGIDVPDLVFVGRPGWRLRDIMDRIEDSRYLDGRLHILHGLTDDALSSLYDRCLFTVFPSFVEGWGLPVGESLARGKVCVASSTTSIPEAGGEYAIYVDPLDVDAGYGVISELIRNPAELERHEAKLRRSFKPRSWTDVGQDFFTKLESLAGEVQRRKTPRRDFAPFVPAGRPLNLPSIATAGRRGAPYVRNPERLVLAEGWREAERSGTWMLDADATVRIRTACEPGQQVDILLHIGTSPWVDIHNTLHIRAAEPSDDNSGTKRPMRRSTNSWVTIRGHVGAGGHLAIQFRVNGPVRCDPPDVAVALRLYAVGYAPTDDLAARLQLVETALLSPEA